MLPLHYSPVRYNELYHIRLTTLEIGVKGVGRADRFSGPWGGDSCIATPELGAFFRGMAAQVPPQRRTILKN